MSTTPSLDTSGTAPELTLADLDPPQRSAPRDGLLLLFPELDVDALDAALATIASTFPEEDLQVALSGSAASQAVPPGIRLVHTISDRAPSGWVLTAADYAALAGLGMEDPPPAVLLLGDPAGISNPGLLRRLADCVRGSKIDLALPRFTLGPGDGLVNSAILYPLTRALFGADVRFPLPIHAALSPRMVQRLVSITRRQTGPGQTSSLVWPVAEAAIAGFSVRQVDAAAALPTLPAPDDFNVLFNSVAGSLFADIETKASFWQRARNLNLPHALDPLPVMPAVELDTEIQPMIESFQLAQANLQEIWALVLPPQSRLALKKLSLEPDAHFAIEPRLWARVVYDFVLAFHLRTLNRGHLLGALIPLYLAWVASHLRTAAGDADRALHHTDETAAAFETEKPYLVSRWRWPDRFNP